MPKKDKESIQRTLTLLRRAYIGEHLPERPTIPLAEVDARYTPELMDAMDVIERHGMIIQYDDHTIVNWPEPNQQQLRFNFHRLLRIMPTHTRFEDLDLWEDTKREVDLYLQQVEELRVRAMPVFHISENLTNYARTSQILSQCPLLGKLKGTPLYGTPCYVETRRPLIPPERVELINEMAAYFVLLEKHLSAGTTKYEDRYSFQVTT